MMTKEEAIECLMYMMDNVMLSTHEEKAMDIAIRSLEAWENLEPDAEYDDFEVDEHTPERTETHPCDYGKGETPHNGNQERL